MIQGKPKWNRAIEGSQSMACPECGVQRSCVLDTDHYHHQTRRRRCCLNGHRFTTYEKAIKPAIWSDFQI